MLQSKPLIKKKFFWPYISASFPKFWKKQFWWTPEYYFFFKINRICHYKWLSLILTGSLHYSNQLNHALLVFLVFFLRRRGSTKNIIKSFLLTSNDRFSAYVKSSKKLAFLVQWYVHVLCASRSKNVSFLENFAYLLNG